MLKRMSIRKIMVASLSLVALFLIYLMPGNSNDDYIIETTSVEYLYTNTLETLYLLDSNNYIARTSIKGYDGDILDIVHDVVSALIIGGDRSDIIPNGFRAVIPSGTEILDISIADDLVTVDLSSEILSINALYEERMIESIIYTLTDIEGIDRVKLLVNGDVLDKLPNSGKSLPLIMDRSYGIQETFKKQIVFNRIQLRDSQCIGNQASCRRTTARPYHNIMVSGKADKIPHDQEIIHVSHIFNRCELVF